MKSNRNLQRHEAKQHKPLKMINMTLDASNIHECFGRLVEELYERCDDGIFQSTGSSYYGFAQATRVGADFASDIATLAIERLLFTPTLMFSIGLYTICYEAKVSVGTTFEYGDQQKIVEMLGQKEEMVQRLVDLFYQFDESVAKKRDEFIGDPLSLELH